MTLRDDIIRDRPLFDVMQDRGIVIKKMGGKFVTNRCATTEHKSGHFCVALEPEKQVWYCNDCSQGGSVIDFVMMADGLDAKGAMDKLGGDTPFNEQKPATAPLARSGTGKGAIVKLYDYTDETGALLFQVCRYEPKDFRQRRPDGSGGWVWTLDDTRRVLYNLPAVLAADFVFICEGEKDADTLTALGWVATTNCGGAKKWDASYSAALRGKDVAILPDNDAKGKEHREALMAALAPVAKAMRIVEMPEGIKDVTEFIESFPEPKDGARMLLEMLTAAEVLYRGESVPIQTMGEMERDYIAYLETATTHEFRLGGWIPSLGRCVRPLVPGELCTILASTGCGKTMILQNIALNSSPLVTLLFELELPGTLSFERFAAMATKQSGYAVETGYKSGKHAAWREGGRLQNIVCCHKSGLTPERIARIIETAHLKTTVRPVLVLIDYIQLVGGDGDSRYERTSAVAEKFKQIAKETKTIIVMASQVGRASTENGKKKGPAEVTLTGGKDSGSIENSSGLVIGAWRDEHDAERMWLRVLKNTKGIAGKTIPCRIDASLLIHEEANESPDEEEMNFQQPPRTKDRNYHDE